jgi:branched-chain amino acid transport system permease protein
VILAALLALLGTIGLAVVPATPALAQGSESVRGAIRSEGEGVAGVRITVTSESGESVGEATTDADGAWEVPVPGPGTYVVTLDTATLPAELPGVRQDTVTTVVNAQQAKAVLFVIGEPTGEGGVGPPAGGTSRLDTAAQLTVEGLRFGLILALAALGLSMIFGTTGLTNFSHGELITFGAIVAWWFNSAGLHIVPAALLAIVLSGAFGYAQDVGLWRPLRRRGTGLIAAMIVSIGLALFLRNLYLYRFGGETRSYLQYATQQGISIGPVTQAPRDYVSMVIALVAILAVTTALSRTRLGKATRAVSDNPALAASSGIDVDRVIRVVWVFGAALAGLSGVLLGLSQQVNYQMGFQSLLLVFAAVILGGLGTIWGSILGAIIVGVFIQVSTLVVPAELKNAGVLAVLIIILLIRPQGLLGRRERIG